MPDHPSRVVERIIGFDKTEERTARRLPWAGIFVRGVLASTAASIGAGIPELYPTFSCFLHGWLRSYQPRSG